MTTTPIRQELGDDDPRTLGGLRLLYRTEESLPRPRRDSGAPQGSRPPGQQPAAEPPGSPVPEGVRTYLARSPRDARTVVVTAVKPDRAGDRGLRAWLEQDARAATAAACRWTVPVVDADPEAAVPWVARAHCPALPLVGYVEQWGPLPEPGVRLLGAALAEALAALHRAGLTHPGLGPETVTLAADGPRLVGLGHTVPGGDRAADVRAWGEIVVYAATGQRGEEAVARLSPQLAAVVRPAFAAAPQDRPTPERLRAALDGLRPAAESTAFPLAGPAVARLAAQAAAALAAEAPVAEEVGAQSPDGASGGAAGAGGDHPTRQLRLRDTPTARLRPVPAEAVPPPDTPRDAPAQPAPGGDATVRPASPSTDPATPTPTEDARTTADAPSRPAGGAPPAGTSRRRLLGLVGAGAVGVLAGGGAVAGWVTGRGGTEALTAPSAPGSGQAARQRHTAPAGTPPTVLWRYDIPVKSGKNTPLTWAGRLAVVLGTYGAVGLDLRTGREVWSREDVASRTPGLPIGRETAVVAADGQFVAFSARDGKRRWADEDFFQSGRGKSDLIFEASGGLLSVTDDGRTLFFVGRDIAYPVPEDRAEYYLVAYDTRARRERWRAPLPRAYANKVVAEPRGDTVILLGKRDGVSEATGYRLTDGRKLWHRAHENVGASDRVTYSIRNGMFFVASGEELRAVELRSGRERWRRRLAAYPKTRLGYGVLRPAPAGRGNAQSRRGRVYYLADTERNVYAVDPDTGDELWRASVHDDSEWGDTFDLETSASGRTLLAASSSGLAALDARTGRELWHFREAPHQPLEPYVVHPVGDMALVINNEVLFALPVV